MCLRTMHLLDQGKAQREPEPRAHDDEATISRRYKRMLSGLVNVQACTEARDRHRTQVPRNLRRGN